MENDSPKWPSFTRMQRGLAAGRHAVSKLVGPALLLGILVGISPSVASAERSDEDILSKVDVAKMIAVITAYSGNCVAKRITPMLPQEVFSAVNRAADAQHIDINSPTFRSAVLAQKTFADIEVIAQYPDLLNDWCQKMLEQFRPTRYLKAASAISIRVRELHPAASLAPN